MKVATYAKESDLCAAFIAALPVSWVAYPETAGFDILLVRRADGFQIGVEAKLRLNPKVVSQALGNDWDWCDTGPDCRAVLVPRSAIVDGMGVICAHLALTVIGLEPAPSERTWVGRDYDPELPAPGATYAAEYANRSWYELAPMSRLPLPDYVPDVAAGASGPVQLTQWKIGALKVCALLDARGYVTRADFRALKVDPRRWVEQGWLEPSEAVDRGGGPKSRLVRRGDPLPFVLQHPAVFAEIKATMAKWWKQPETGVAA